jgi:pimeloyl-ACP methyl ester carboxylesterase
VSRRRPLPTLGAGLAAGLSAIVWREYLRDIRRARERVSAGSRTVETPQGPIEYGSAGDGPPVLVVHGGGGGFDQGLEVADPLVRNGFRVVAPSRFGYLGSPVPDDASPAAQADAYALLLNALDLPRAAVVGASAGAPSAMQFALRHPDRTTALVLLVPAAYPSRIDRRPGGAMPSRTTAVTRFLFDVALRSDFLFWIAPKIARNAMLRTILGTPPSALRNASAEERSRILRVLDQVQPLSLHRLGLLNDAAVVRSLPRYELERIAAPTLVLAVEDCLYGTWEGARYTAEHIPGARFVGYQDGGHLWAGHQDEFIVEITGFLRKAAGDASIS